MITWDFVVEWDTTTSFHIIVNSAISFAQAVTVVMREMFQIGFISETANII